MFFLPWTIFSPRSLFYISILFPTTTIALKRTKNRTKRSRFWGIFRWLTHERSRRASAVRFGYQEWFKCSSTDGSVSERRSLERSVNDRVITTGTAAAGDYPRASARLEIVNAFFEFWVMSDTVKKKRSALDSDPGAMIAAARVCLLGHERALLDEG